MKNLQINESSIGAQEYNLVELVGSNINVYQKLPPPGLISVLESTAADYCLYDKSNDKLIIVKRDTDLSNYPIDNYTPIGIVVVPGSHNVYDDGSCGVMSLKSMDCDTPTTGGTSENDMYWGVKSTDILSLSNLTQVPIANNQNGIPTEQSNYGYLPSDKLSGSQCIHDSDVYYYDSNTYMYPPTPSPYLTDGSRNTGYYQTTSPLSSNNSLADFDGIGNTKKIITQRGTKDYGSWTPTFNSQTDYPAASCCDMFYTEGTQQGNWYLPAMGELGYIMPPFNKINQAITNMQNTYGSDVGVTLGMSHNYQSSSEFDSTYAWCVDVRRGTVQGYLKSGSRYVRAFLRVNQEGKPVNS